MDLPRRRRMRLQGFDYSQPEAYFVTICTAGHRCLFGETEDGTMRLSPIGACVQRCWNAIPNHFPNVALDAFVIMPNHIHGILVFSEARAGHAQPLQAVVGGFKSAVSREVGFVVWQRGYWDRIIRGEAEWQEMNAYIEANPARWPL
jgi:putative transposase